MQVWKWTNLIIFCAWKLCQFFSFCSLSMFLAAVKCIVANSSPKLFMRQQPTRVEEERLFCLPWKLGIFTCFSNEDDNDDDFFYKWVVITFLHILSSSLTHAPHVFPQLSVMCRNCVTEFKSLVRFSESPLYLRHDTKHSSTSRKFEWRSRFSRFAKRLVSPWVKLTPSGKWT